MTFIGYFFGIKSENAVLEGNLSLTIEGEEERELALSQIDQVQILALPHDLRKHHCLSQ